MTLPVTRLRRWLAALAILMIATVLGMYSYARWRIRNALREVPAKLDITVQQTAEGFSISKSDQGRTIFTVRASKVVQFKQGGVAELHDVQITIYGRDSSRFDRISGQEFEFNPGTGEVAAKGRVSIDLQANPEGTTKADQAIPQRLQNPIHIETDGLVFNRNTGNASAPGRVSFETLQAKGTARGVQYVANTATMTLTSSVAMDLKGPHATQVTAERAVLTRTPRQVVLSQAQMVREQLTLRSQRATLFLRDDNTVDRLLADGGVSGEVQGPSAERGQADQAELFLTGSRNVLQTAVLTGNVRVDTQGDRTSSIAAGRATLHFGGQQVLRTVHAEEGVRLTQKKEVPPSTVAGGAPAPKPEAARILQAKEQDLDMTAPAMDLLVKHGKYLDRAETSGPPQILITQPGAGQQTVVTAGKFVAGFSGENRLSSLHGEPDTRIVSSAPGQPDRLSTSQTLDVAFLPAGGIRSIQQQGSVAYSGGTQTASAQVATYTPEDQTIALNGAPRVADGAMTTSAQVIRINRTTGEALAEGNVHSTYSDLKVQPDGAMLASDDPIHVTSHSMVARQSSAVAVYTGNARLWQDANLVEAPKLEFDRDQRSLVATGTSAAPVTTVLVQQSKNGSVTPITTQAGLLTYHDVERKIYLDGGVTSRAADATMTAQQMTVFLVPREPTGAPPGGTESRVRPLSSTDPARAGTSAKVDHLVAQGSVVLTEPGRRATGDWLEYTAAEEKFVLKGGPPSIFDAERGKTTGDSLTFYRHDDRVLVEGKEASPTVTRTRVAR